MSETRLSREKLSFLETIQALGVTELVKILLVDSRALRVFLTNFLLTYNLRTGFSLLVRILTVIRKE